MKSPGNKPRAGAVRKGRKGPQVGSGGLKLCDNNWPNGRRRLRWMRCFAWLWLSLGTKRKHRTRHSFWSTRR